MTIIDTISDGGDGDDDEAEMVMERGMTMMDRAGWAEKITRGVFILIPSSRTSFLFWLYERNQPY